MMLLGEDSARDGGNLHVNGRKGTVGNGAAESTSESKASVEVDALWGFGLDLLGHGGDYCATVTNKSCFEEEESQKTGRNAISVNAHRGNRTN